MTSMAGHHLCPMQGPSHAYVFVNEADIYQNPDGSEYSYVTVIDTRPQEVGSPLTQSTWWEQIGSPQSMHGQGPKCILLDHRLLAGSEWGPCRCMGTPSSSGGSTGRTQMWREPFMSSAWTTSMPRRHLSRWACGAGKWGCHCLTKGTFGICRLPGGAYLLAAAFVTLQGFKTNTGHGKLLVDDSLYPIAYSTNVNEQVETGCLSLPWRLLRLSQNMAGCLSAMPRCLSAMPGAGDPADKPRHTDAHKVLQLQQFPARPHHLHGHPQHRLLEHQQTVRPPSRSCSAESPRPTVTGYSGEWQ